MKQWIKDSIKDYELPEIELFKPKLENKMETTIRIKKSFSQKIDEMVEKYDGLTSGYIGNFERWGDDRLLYISVDGMKSENGNSVRLWQADAKTLDQKDVATAWKVLNAFDIGRKAANI